MSIDKVWRLRRSVDLHVVLYKSTAVCGSTLLTYRPHLLFITVFLSGIDFVYTDRNLADVATFEAILIACAEMATWASC